MCDLKRRNLWSLGWWKDIIVLGAWEQRLDEKMVAAGDRQAPLRAFSEVGLTARPGPRIHISSSGKRDERRMTGKSYDP